MSGTDRRGFLGRVFGGGSVWKTAKEPFFLVYPFWVLRTTPAQEAGLMEALEKKLEAVAPVQLFRPPGCQQVTFPMYTAAGGISSRSVAYLVLEPRSEF